MRIGLMADTYKPHISGVTNYMALNKRALEGWGHEVYIFTFGDSDYLDDEPRVIRSPGVPLIDTGYYVSFGYSREVRSFLQTMDLVHVQHPFLSGQLALRYCKPLGIPIVFTNHTRYDLYLQAYLPILPDELGETFIRAYLPGFCREIDQVISPSEGMRAVLRRLGVDTEIEVIPNGVDLRAFLGETELITREEMGFTPENIILVYSGRLAPEKNLAFLVRSFIGISRTYPEARLLLIGDGPERPGLQELAEQAGLSKNVRFAGMVPYDRIPGYLRVCDLFATASVTEVHPLSLIEAMASGLPGIGISSPGIGDTIEDGVTGLLCTYDLAEFTAKLGRLVGDGELRGKMGQAARQAAEKFAIERTTGELLNCFHRVIDHAERSRTMDVEGASG